MKTSLYNQDGTLSAQAQSLLSPKPDDMSIAERRKRIKEFKCQLSEEEIKEFIKLKARFNSKKWNDNNSEKAKQFCKNWKAKNPKKVKRALIKWRTNNPEKRRKDYAKWKKENPEKAKEINARWYKKNSKKAYFQKMKHRKTPKGRLREAVYNAFKRIGKNKPTNTLELLGCSWEEAKAHIEGLWQEGMTWDNHGRYGWHIDHIRPVSSFEEHELDKMNHISNLQPLWAKDNLEKSSKW